MELNIYTKKDGKQVIEKTYKADTYDLMFGTVEDVAEAIHIDELNGEVTDQALLMLVMKFAMRSKDTVKDLMKDIFNGLTDDELKNTKVAEMARVLVEVIQYTIGQITKGVRGE